MISGAHTHLIKHPLSTTPSSFLFCSLLSDLGSIPTPPPSLLFTLISLRIIAKLRVVPSTHFHRRAFPQVQGDFLERKPHTPPKFRIFRHDTLPTTSSSLRTNSPLAHLFAHLFAGIGREIGAADFRHPAILQLITASALRPTPHQHNMDPGEQRRRSNAQNRKAKFLATQAALPEHERLDAATRDWNVVVWRQLSEGRETMIASMKRGFIEFLTDEDLPMKLSPDAAADYFKIDGSVVTTRVLRMFLEFMAQSHTGTHPKADGRLNITTVHAYVHTLGVALSRAQNPLEREIKNAAHAWIDAYLVPKGMVATLGKDKYTCYDISLLVSTIFSPEYTATMPDTRAPLQLVLFLTLAIDCSGRVGEFVSTRGKKKNTYLRWRHATLTAIRTTAGVTLQGTLRFENLKDFNGDPSKHKTIPLRLLPLELAAEDSFRLLIVLGLIDQVFEGLHCWEDIQRLRPGPDGSRVRIKQSALDYPIFRMMEKRQVTELPLKYHIIYRELDRLGRYLGLEHRLLCGAIRRGAAYLLSVNCTEEERCARMGHKKGDAVYWNHYRNETSTVDFQALIHHVEEVDLGPLSSITIHRRPDAPQKPSQAAYREMWQLPHIAELRDTQLLLFDQIITTYGSMKQARAALAVEIKEYDGVSSKYKRACEVAISAIFSRELAEFFASDCPMEPVDPSQIISPSTMDDDSSLVTHRDEHEEGEDDEMTKAVSASSIITRGVSDAVIDPVLLGETSRNFLDAFGDSNPDLQIGAADSLDFPDCSPEKLARISQYRTGKTILRPVTLVDAVFHEISRAVTVLSESELAHLMIKSFNHMYPSDHFHPGEEPIPGTRNCRFCDKDLWTLGRESVVLHVHCCHKRILATTIVNELDANYAPTDKCSWIRRKAKAGQTAEECGRKANEFPSFLQWIRHLNTHIVVRGNNTTIECRFGNCTSAEKTTQFKSQDALGRHITIEHRLRLTRAESDQGVAERLIWWCPICFQFINQLEEDIDEHARSHVQIVNDIIHTDGYTGLEIANLAIIPAFCIFCVHDTDKSESIRFNNWHSRTNLAEHVYQHVNSHDPDTLAPCPASINTECGITSTCLALPMKPTDLAAHLHSSHGIRSQPKPKKTRKKSDEADDESEQQKPPKKGQAHGSHRVLQAKQTNLTMRPAGQGMSLKDPKNGP